jgi:hypothetical protein
MVFSGLFHLAGIFTQYQASINQAESALVWKGQAYSCKINIHAFKTIYFNVRDGKFFAQDFNQISCYFCGLPL